MIAALQEMAGYEFLRHAFFAGLLASVLCGVVGTFVVVKRLVFLSGGISHAAFGGLGACYALGLDPRLGAAGTAVLSAWILSRTGRGHRRRNDATIGVLWALGMAVGILLIHLTPGYAPDLTAYLFGNILGVGRSDIVLLAILAVLVLGLLSVYYKETVALVFDEDFAATQGVPVRGALTVWMIAVALSIALSIQLVGILLVLALLTIPPLIGLRLSKGFFGVIVTACLAGAAMTSTGLVLSYAYELPSGPAIVVVGAAALGAVYAVTGRPRVR